MLDTYINSLKWRYATKKFDTERKIPAADLEQLMNAIQLSASSYGLQPYHVFIISDTEIRQRLKTASYEQSQVIDASHLLVFASKTDFDGELINSYLKEVSETRDIELEKLEGYSAMMKSKLLPLPEGAKANWAARQAYIALGNFLSAASMMSIDACPMEGFDTQAVDEILGLEQKNLSAAVIVAVGYRSEMDKTQYNKKVRRSKQTLFTHLGVPENKS